MSLSSLAYLLRISTFFLTIVFIPSACHRAMYSSTQRPSTIRIPTHLIRVAIISDLPRSQRGLVATINAVRNASHSHARGTIACRGCRGTHNTITGSTLVCYLSCVVCCTIVLSPMRCEYGLKSHVYNWFVLCFLHDQNCSSEQGYRGTHNGSVIPR